MDYDREKGDEKGLETATIMRDNYQDLHSRLSDDYKMNKDDAIKLLVATLIQINQLQDRIEMLRRAMTGYQTDLMPKLQEIVDNAKNDEEAIKIAEEKFIIDNNK